MLWIIYETKRLMVRLLCRRVDRVSGAVLACAPARLAAGAQRGQTGGTASRSFPCLVEGGSWVIARHFWTRTLFVCKISRVARIANLLGICLRFRTLLKCQTIMWHIDSGSSDTAILLFKILATPMLWSINRYE